MKTCSNHALYTIVVILLTGMHLKAQFSFTTMSYQGSINENGLPANGTNDLQFTVYDALTNGSIVGGPLIKDDVVLSNGLFSVTLDFGTGVFNGQARWMELAVRPGDGTNAFSVLSPRQPVSAVPYAIQANEASTSFSIVGALPSTNLVGTYGETINFTSDNNVFLGTFNGAGTGLTNVNAQYLNGFMAADFWQLDGNAGTTGGQDFVGTTDNRALEFRVSNVRALRLEPTGINGAVNVVGGSPVNFVAPGVVGGTIGGGGTLDDGDSTSHTNRVLADYGTVGGGLNNVAGGFSSTVSGGLANQILEFNSSNSGIGSGSGNVISNAGACSISGGVGNRMEGGATWSHIGGGFANTISGDYAVVPGGRGNVAAANYSFAAGRRAKASHIGSFIWADSTDADFASTGLNQFLIRASGGVGFGETNPLAQLHIQNEDQSLQASALENDELIIEAMDATIGLYSQNQGDYGSALAFKEVQNDGSIQDTWGWVRQSSSAEADMMLTYGASDNYAANPVRMIIRTNGNVGIGTTTPESLLEVRGSLTCQVGGGNNDNLIIKKPGALSPSNIRFILSHRTTGDDMWLYGYDGSTFLNLQGWDYAENVVRFPANGNTLHIDMASGRVGIGTDNPTNKLEVAGTVAGTSFITTSDRNAKENFQSVSPADVLAKVAALPIQQWNFKADADTTHIGPMAQDFYAAFGVGPDDRHIATVDADGVALAAIQGLNQKVEGRTRKAELRIQKLEAENAELRSSLKELKALVQTMNHRLNGGAR